MEKEDVLLEQNKDDDSRMDHAEPAWAKSLRDQLNNYEDHEEKEDEKEEINAEDDRMKRPGEDNNEDKQKTPIVKQISATRRRKGSRKRKSSKSKRSPYIKNEKKNVDVPKAPNHSFLTNRRRYDFYIWYKSSSVTSNLV
ncbi:hypothetical protein V2J09_006192 [Rumex salicifolius]